MTLSDTVSSCCQDHGLSRRVASDIAERVMDRLAEEAEQGCTVAAALLKPVDRARLRAMLLDAARVATDDTDESRSAAYRLGYVESALKAIAREAGLPEVAEEIGAMLDARHERWLIAYDARMALLAPLASDEASVDWAGCTPDGAEPPLERDRRTSEVPA